MFKNLSPAALGISAGGSEIIELTLSSGFKGLDLDMVDFSEQVKTHGMAKASRLIVSARLKIGSFPLPVRWESEGPEYQADLKRLAALLPLAVEMKATRATTNLEASSDSRPYHQNFEFHRQRLAEVAEVLRPHQIRLGVGLLAPVACREGRAFQFMQTVDEALLLLRSVNATNIGLAFDSWHWHLGGGKLETLSTLPSGSIVTVALADADPSLTAANARLEDRKLPGDGGAVDTPALLAALAQLSYDGPLTPAPNASQFPGQSREKIVKAAGAAIDKAWKEAGLNNAGKLTTVSGR